MRPDRKAAAAGRDRHIRKLHEAGLSTSEIAERLGLKRRTIEARLRRTRNIAAKRPERRADQFA